MAAALAALSEHSVLSASDHPLISKLTGTWKGVPVVHPFWTNSASDEEVRAELRAVVGEHLRN